MPILLYMNDDINDDASDDGCPYIYQVSGARASTPSLWTKYDSWKEQIKEPIHESIGATEQEEDSADFHGFQMMTDTAISQDYEGLWKEKDFYSDEQWLITNQYGRAWLTDERSKNSRDLMASRILRKPLKVMQNHVDAILGRKTEKSDQVWTKDDPKFVIYSAHDDQVDSMMVFLTGTKESFDYIRYAAQVTFELLYSQSCVEGKAFLSQPGEECFSVSVRFDG